jgi:aminoglycoside phosphotransferase (APT) family kinase protein
MRHRGHLGSFELIPIAELLSEAKYLEESLKAPFTVRIHGDFNLSNLLYNHENQKLTFVDIYRSREADYLQDISVMLLSIIRLPVTDNQARLRLNQASRMAESLARKFAQEENDETYRARLAFGLARSFVTSTRFVMEERMAIKFVARARYLLGKIISHRKKGLPWTDFKFSLDVLDIFFD